MANETRIFRIPPNMPVQAVASHVDHYLRANQGLQVQGASNGEECVLQCRQEKDGWKIRHIVVSTDLVSEAGEDYSEQEVYHNYETNPVDVEFGTPTIAKLIHNTDFNWWDNYPPMPEAYETFSDAVSYGPEGYVRPALYGLNSKEGRNFR